MKSKDNSLPTKWYHYLIGFFIGIFFINVFPHYIHGITGKMFPTPFASPPGKGLSSPTLNVIWATINFSIGFLLFYFSKIHLRNKLVWIAVAAGGLLMSFYLAHYFGSLGI